MIVRGTCSGTGCARAVNNSCWYANGHVILYQGKCVGYEPMEICQECQGRGYKAQEEGKTREEV